MDLMRAIISNWIKTKRTAFRYIVLLVPILFPALVLSYISVYKIDYTFQIKVYNLYFETIALGLTLMEGLLTALNIMGEESSGDFRALLASPLPRNTIYFGKLFMIILITIIDMFVSVGILLIGIKFIYKGAYIQYGPFLQGTLFTTIGVLFLYGFYLIISINFGMGHTIAITAGGTILGALMQTGMGDRIWQFIPWSWSGRIGILPIAKLKGAVDSRYGDSTMIMMKEFYKGMPILIISFLVICIIGALWFKKWEGRKSY